MAIRLALIVALMSLGAAVFAGHAPQETCSARHGYATCFAQLNR